MKRPLSIVVLTVVLVVAFALAGCSAAVQVLQTQIYFTNFNTSALTIPAVETYGNTGMGILRQPAWSNWDMTLSRKIPLGKNERRLIRVRIEAYNIFNHTEF